MESCADLVKVSTQPLDLLALTRAVSSPAAGAISSFVGTTRNSFHGKRVLRLEYEGYVPMAEKKMKEICDRIRERWNVLNVSLSHRLGVVPVGESSVIVAISSEHRSDSLHAVQYAIDEIKSIVPIWKKEFYETPEGVEVGVWKENSECCFTRHKTLDRALADVN